MSKSILEEKSKQFAILIMRELQEIEKTYVNNTILSQITKSGTSIGANIHEAKFAQSKSDFISKLSIALKEASETEYWLEIMYESNLIKQNAYKRLDTKCKELIKMLVSSIKTAKAK